MAPQIASLILVLVVTWIVINWELWGRESIKMWNFCFQDKKFEGRSGKEKEEQEDERSLKVKLGLSLVKAFELEIRFL